MDAAVAGLIGAAIGAVAGLMGAFFTSIVQSRIEEKKWRRSKQDTLSKELRLQIAEVSRKMLVAQHSMEWITWYAREGPKHLDKKMISEYNKEIHDAFPELLGALAITAALNLDIYNQLSIIADEIYGIEGRIAKALFLFDEAPEECIEKLAKYNSEATAFYKNCH